MNHGYRLLTPKSRCIDLFAGAGGFAEGFRQAGWTIVSAVDNNEPAAKTFKANFPGVNFFLQNVEELDPSKLRKISQVKSGDLDCLIGGPPCQSFSYNNHARSARSQRAKLFQQYLRIVKALRPKTLVMENVPGMLTINNGGVVAEICSELGCLGYDVGVRILYAEDYGVPQQRRRVFIIGTRLGWSDSLFPAGTHGPSNKPKSDRNNFIHRWNPRKNQRPSRIVRVWDAIGDLPSVEAETMESVTRYKTSPSTHFQRNSRRSVKQLYNHVAHRMSPKMLRRVQLIPEGGNWRDLPRRLLPSGMKRAKLHDHTKRYGRLSRRGISCTILTKCDPHWGSYIHPIVNRRITVREAARLQSFPDRFRFFGTISNAYEQVGNAVPPLLAKRIGEALKSHLGKRVVLRNGNGATGGRKHASK